MKDIEQPAGLGDTDSKDWPSVSAAQAAERPIDRLVPDSPLHAKVKDYLCERIKMSERNMGRFYSRWRINEAKVQAYVDLPEYEKQLKEMNQNHKPPEVVSIVVPYSFATISTIVTYLVQAFCGRKPMFQIGSNKAETAQSARNMELMLQYNADHTRLARHMFQWLNDGEVYGVGILRTQWRREQKMRTVWTTQPRKIMGMPIGGMEKVKSRAQRLVYEGNAVCSIDPYMFFPDPRVPMVEVNKRGEFVFWRSYEGKHSLLKAQAEGELKWVDTVRAPLPRSNNTNEDSDNARTLLSGGTATAVFDDPNKTIRDFYQVDQGTVEIIPAELGLGDSETPEKWLFTMLNKSQIVQAEPFEADHDMHPVAVIEPYTLGYGFGNPGVTDYLSPLQDTISWFINSHIHNVRAALNNMFVVDPSMVEMQDLKRPGPGKIIRLRQAAYGQDVRSALQQFAVADVTQRHINDLQGFMRMGDSLSAVTDNLRGLQDSGGRKTATEVRTGAEAGASRLASHARLISAQGVVDLTEQMSLNIQQNQSEEFYIEVLGQDGMNTPVQLSPEMLVGDFHYPVNDGTLPIDRVAMLDVWKEIFLAVSQDQQLRQEYDAGKIFEYVAELGGARNIEQFKNVRPNVQMAPEGAVADGVKNGNLAPVGASGMINALGGRAPGARMAGGL